MNHVTPWSVPVEACTTLTNTNSDPACVKVCIDGGTDGVLDVQVSNWDEMPLGIEASLAPIGCTFDSNNDLSGKVFLCKVIDEETQAITYAQKHVSIDGTTTDYDPNINGNWSNCDGSDPDSFELGCLWFNEAYNGKAVATADGVFFYGLDGTIEPYVAVDHGVISGCPIEVEFPDQIYTVPVESCYTTPDGAVTIKGVMLKAKMVGTCELISSVTCSSDANFPIGTDITEVPTDWVQTACDDCISEDTDCVGCQ